MALNATTFSKCAPSISTDIKRCGTVTICNAKPVTAHELTSIYLKSNDYRVMEALFHHDMEIKQCEAVQNGLYDFFMANKVSVNKKMTTRRLDSGLIEIAPFVMARQYSPINNEYWGVTNGQASGGNWSVRVASTTNIPADVRSFPSDDANNIGIYVFIQGRSAGGSATRTAYRVKTSTLSGDGTYVTLVLVPQNAASHLDPDKTGNPVTGILTRGTPNVSDFEKFCAETPAYINWKNVPFWVQTHRWSMCRSTQYDKWRKLLLEDNILYREFGDLSEIEKNKQIASDAAKRFVQNVFWQKALPGQNAGDYDTLQEIDAFPGVLDANGNQILGVDGGTCVGKRANAIGIYEQMAECGRITDLQNGQLNLPALFVELYNMMRVRQGRGHPNPRSFDIFTDSVFAELFNQAMIAYYNAKSQNTMRLVKDIDRDVKKAEFGFYYESYKLFWPQGMVINIITHEYFDDWLTAGATISTTFESTCRVLWILDFTGIYVGVLASNEKDWDTGKLKDLAAINQDYACVLEVNTRRQMLRSMTYTVIVECPMANLIIEGIAAQVPEPSTLSGTYPAITTSSTTSTATPFIG